MIKVLIADDQKLLRESLKDILEHTGEIEVTGCAENGSEALEICKSTNPEVVLMDINMPVCDGVEGITLVKNYNNDIKIIALTSHYDETNMVNALIHGADGYILKDVAPEILTMVIISTAAGLHVFSHDPYTLLNKELTYNAKNRDIICSDIGSKPLNDKEYMILQMIADGKNNKEIASEMYLCEGRVKNIISGIFTKLKLKDRYQLISYAYRNNIIK